MIKRGTGGNSPPPSAEFVALYSLVPQQTRFLILPQLLGAELVVTLPQPTHGTILMTPCSSHLTDSRWEMLCVGQNKMSNGGPGGHLKRCWAENLVVKLET